MNHKRQEFTKETNLKQNYNRDFDVVKKFFSQSDKAKIIKEDLPKFVEAMANKGSISKSQIRKHFNYLLDIYQDALFNGAQLEEKHRIKLAMEKVYANYDFARRNINDYFKNFIEELVNEIVESKDFKTFEEAKVLFEALVGYSTLFVKKN
jgi:CRISPR type III-A-associated protein Csm2